MTTLPTRAELTTVGVTYGAFRTGFGDTISFLEEALGRSGLAPEIKNSTLLNTVKIGVRTANPGADVQIFGGLSVTSSAASSLNPGDGSLLIDNQLKFATTLGSKISFPSAVSGQGAEIGRQTDSLYLRTKLGGNIIAYAGGLHADGAFAPGINGVELLRVNETEFKYKGQTIYHSGNGVFIRKDQPGSATSLVTFNAGLAVPSNNITIGTSANPNTTGKILWNTGILGSKIHFHSALEDYSIGIQPSTIYLRTGGNFVIYRGGSFVDSPTPTPGVNGETLLHVSGDTFQYKGQNIFHAANSNFVIRTSLNRPGVIKLYTDNVDDSAHVRADFNSFGDGRMRLLSISGNGGVLETRTDFATHAFLSAYDGKRLTVNESAARPGVTRLYRSDSDEGSYAQMYFDGSRFFLEGKGGAGQNIPIRVERADGAAYADNSGATNYIHGQNIQDGTVRFYELSRGEGIATNITRFGVHQFAFASPVTSHQNGRYLTMGNASSGGSPDQRSWSIIDNGGVFSGNYSTRWDYITGSGDPYTWVMSDATDQIIASWDAEDPFDREFPDSSPILLDNGSPDPKAILIEYPPVKEIISLTEGGLKKYNLPPWLSKHKFSDKKTPKDLYWALLKDYAKGRNGMHQLAEEDMTMWDFIETLPGDEQKKNWRKQGALKVLSRMAYGSVQPKVHDFLREHYKVNKKTGKLSLK